MTVQEEINAYLKNHFEQKLAPDQITDDTYLEAWTPVFELAGTEGAAVALNTFLCPSRPVSFIESEGVTLELYESSAGKIPVIKIRNVQDFEAFTTNACHKGIRPANLEVTGASFVSGKTNRFIILSNKPYSNVSAATLGIEESDWKEKSMAIRLEHECTHFWTKKFYGTAMNHIHDELIADFFGILNAFGEYKAEYFEYFIGCKGTEGKRILAYVPENASPEFIDALKERSSIFARWLEKLAKTDEFLSRSKCEKIEMLCNIKLSDIK